jgi:hypothetical protein
MPDEPRIRPSKTWHEEAVDRSLEVSARSTEVLRQCHPDTFLGRKSHEPFAKEEEP